MFQGSALEAEIKIVQRISQGGKQSGADLIGRPDCYFFLGAVKRPLSKLWAISREAMRRFPEADFDHGNLLAGGIIGDELGDVLGCRIGVY
jgi:hypothetical protein